MIAFTEFAVESHHEQMNARQPTGLEASGPGHQLGRTGSGPRPRTSSVCSSSSLSRRRLAF